MVILVVEVVFTNQTIRILRFRTSPDDSIISPVRAFLVNVSGFSTAVAFNVSIERMHEAVHRFAGEGPSTGVPGSTKITELRIALRFFLRANDVFVREVNGAVRAGVIMILDVSDVVRIVLMTSVYRDGETSTALTLDDHRAAEAIDANVEIFGHTVPNERVSKLVPLFSRKEARIAVRIACDDSFVPEPTPDVLPTDAGILGWLRATGSGDVFN
jgi:hypothetical protein